MPPEPFDAAEREMGERLERQYYELSAKLLDRLEPGVDPATPEGKTQIEEAWHSLIEEDPDAREIAEGFAAYMGGELFRRPS